MLPSRLLSRLPFMAGPRRRPIKHLADLGPLPATAARQRGQERASAVPCPPELSPVIYHAAAVTPSTGSRRGCLDGERGRAVVARRCHGAAAGCSACLLAKPPLLLPRRVQPWVLIFQLTTLVSSGGERGEMQIKTVTASGAMSVAEGQLTTAVGCFSLSLCRSDGTNPTVEALLLVKGWRVPAAGFLSEVYGHSWAGFASGIRAVSLRPSHTRCCAGHPLGMALSHCYCSS